MQPPRVSDEAVLMLIRKLTRNATLPTGVELRGALLTRFGHRGGVKRIYRLLKWAHASTLKEHSEGSSTASSHELTQWQARAEAAEEREQAHQVRWARQIDELRTEIAALEPLAQQTRRALASEQILREQLRAAHARINWLEDRLMAEDPNERGVAAELAENAVAKPG